MSKDGSHSGSWLNPGQFAHPNSPMGGSGPGRFRTPGPQGMDGSPSAQLHPQAPAARHMDVNSLRTRADTKKTDTHLLGLIGAGHWDQLKHAGEALLGQQSFGLGVCVGIVKNPVGGLVSLVELQKTFILADLHDRIHRPFSWRSLTPRFFSGPAVALGARALMAVGVISEADLQNAFDVREKLQQELAEVLAHPLNYLGSLPGDIKDQYVAKWSRFQELSKGTDLKSQFEAGEILGDVLMEVVMLIAGVVSGVGTAAKLASKVPELLKLSRVLKRTRDGAALGRAAAAEGAAGGTKAAKAPPKPVPKPPAPESQPRPPSKEPPARPAETATKPGKFKTPVASELAAVEVNGVKPIRVKQGTNGKVAVIGRGMDKNVGPMENKLKEMGYDTELFSGNNISKEAVYDWEIATEQGTKRLTPAEAVQTKMFSENKAWAEKLAKEGYTVVDVGDPAGYDFGPFYQMERETIFGY